ncbi:MAG: hypothetical protein R6V62_08350, partial [Candidatus Fermentibacteraceae bacterium]
ITCQQLACTGNARLHLVGNEEDIVLFTEVIGLFNITVIGYKDTRFTLDGFHKESGQSSGRTPPAMPTLSTNT